MHPVVLFVVFSGSCNNLRTHHMKPISGHVFALDFDQSSKLTRPLLFTIGETNSSLKVDDAKMRESEALTSRRGKRKACVSELWGSWRYNLRRAESSLSDAFDSPNYGLAVLRLVVEPSIDDAIRQAAAVNFKNHLKSRWTNSIPDTEKEQIKSIIVPVMLSSTPRIQSQLSEALSVTGKHEYEICNRSTTSVHVQSRRT
ncbi:hypothetical protein POM88_019153 [Heracleum sosnowskyi]|uniref:Importin N-terminal domain-containing protein n=1 Tax=Heracleum sosnowskyi TaxID=360622 RepID=A0AAD8MVD3_9APIA|nr:hypothetical protein POM88_019153 [Heracleum sosnowskyi]